MISFCVIAGEEPLGRYVNHLLNLAKGSPTSSDRAQLIILVEPAKIRPEDLARIPEEIPKRCHILAISRKRKNLPFEGLKISYFKRPFTPARFYSFVEEILNRKFPLTQEEREHPFIGEEEKIVHIRKSIPILARLPEPILLQGPRGVGKELLARHIHAHRQGKFIKFTAAALPQEMIEPLLFGFKPGVIKNIKKSKEGAFAKAEDGILYIENLEDLPLSAQQRLLLFLENGYFYPLGATEPVYSKIKLIISLATPPEKLLKEGKLLPEIFFKLAEFAIRLPPLKERLVDLPLLVQYFLENYAWIYRKEVISLSLKLFERFLLYPWPRNIAELEEVIKDVIIWGEEKVLEKRFAQMPRVRLKFKDIEDLLGRLMAEKKEIRAQTEPSRRDQASHRTGSR